MQNIIIDWIEWSKSHVLCSDHKRSVVQSKTALVHATLQSPVLVPSVSVNSNSTVSQYVNRIEA
jgi:hypothetical protein